jgi:hypothetical protein
MYSERWNFRKTHERKLRKEHSHVPTGVDHVPYPRYQAGALLNRAKKMHTKHRMAWKALEGVCDHVESALGDVLESDSDQLLDDVTAKLRAILEQAAGTRLRRLMPGTLEVTPNCAGDDERGADVQRDFFDSLENVLSAYGGGPMTCGSPSQYLGSRFTRLSRRL